MFETLVSDPTADAGTVYAWEAGEGHQQPGDRAEHAVHDAGPVAWIGLRQRHGEISHSHAAQPGQREIERTHVASRQEIRNRQWSIGERVQRERGQPVLDCVA